MVDQSVGEVEPRGQAQDRRRGIFPNAAALHRLSACVLIEAQDERQVAERRYLSEGCMAQLTSPAPTVLGINTKPKDATDTRRPERIV